jgi:hypothetical protein
MPKKRITRTIQTNGQTKSGVSLSYAAIGAIVGILAVVSAIWRVGSAVATKADVESIKTAITPILEKHEDRIRTLELQVARYFGASQTSTHPSRSVEQITPADIILAQYSPQSISPNAPRAIERPRRVVVPSEMVQAYDLQPSPGGVYGVLGEDGRLYSLDDVLWVIIRIHLQEQSFRRFQQKK